MFLAGKGPAETGYVSASILPALPGKKRRRPKSILPQQRRNLLSFTNLEKDIAGAGRDIYRHCEGKKYGRRAV